MRLVLVDFHDSYTFNVRELVHAALEVSPQVIAFDDPALPVSARAADALILSPGPGDPRRAEDTGIVPGLLADLHVPVLGVCLGHQILALLAGGRVERVAPRHGHVARLRHAGTGLFAGLPQGSAAVRYHSLAVLEPLPAGLVADAWAEDGTLMALHATDRPWWGVQFHPESVCSELGVELVRAWAREAGLGADAGAGATPATPPAAAVPEIDAGAALLPTGSPTDDPGSSPASTVSVSERDSHAPGVAAPAEAALLWREIPLPADLPAAHEALCGDRAASFWLDSALVVEGRSRWSFLGFPGGADVLSAWPDRVEILDEHGALTQTLPPGSVAALRLRLHRDAAPPGNAACGSAYADPASPGPAAPAAARYTQPTSIGPAPFPLRGGYVGYLGYEARRESGLAVTRADTAPEALWMRASRYLAVDHATGRAYLAAEPVPDAATAQAWLADTAALLAGPLPVPATDLPEALVEAVAATSAHTADDPATYRAKVARAQEFLVSGDSYEVCLTTRADVPCPATPAQLREVYRRQRAANPAPHAALLVVPGVTVLSTSPERFLQVSPGGHVETKPIKGTVPRSADAAADASGARDLAADPKARAELLMVVDLLRNDLARACEPGSVAVPDLMVVESYETVHQLLSRITGRLAAGRDALDLLLAAFPGGSMTGAPKERTLEIIDALEGRARGVYSGALGYLGADGAADLAIVIRTCVHAGGVLSTGAGGAVVLASTPEGEHEEMLLKLAAPVAWAARG